MRILIVNRTDYVLTLQYTSEKNVTIYQIPLNNTLLASGNNILSKIVGLDEIFALLRVFLFGLIVLVALIYCIPIIVNRRFHHRNNILTLNFCVATILCCLYWFIFYIMFAVDRYGTYIFLVNSCMFIFVIPPILTVQIPYSFVTVSIHRLCCIVYYRKKLFKTKKWIGICIFTQWILGILSMLPILYGIELFCKTPRWVEIYKMIFLIIGPFVIFLIVSILIFMNVHSSSRRLRSDPATDRSSHSVVQRKMSARDLHLLRHMIIMLSIFLGGWSPLYVLLAVQNQFLINPILTAIFTIWCQLALLCDIIDLYLYNHELRNYLKAIFVRCCK